jgi:hypothetical protein
VASDGAFDVACDGIVIAVVLSAEV